MPYVLASLPAGGQAQGKWSGGFEWKTEKLKQYSGLWSIHNTTSSRNIYTQTQNKEQSTILRPLAMAKSRLECTESLDTQKEMEYIVSASIFL